MTRLKAVVQGVFACALGGTGVGAAAEESGEMKADGLPEYIERITVVGSRDRASRIGGSASFISASELEAFQHTDVLRVLKQVPGIYSVEEDGFGLRPNIGIRGSGTDRSARITLLEDGILIAPAPYSAPSAYYFPTMQRMQAVEILKGASAIRFGPRTTGGVLSLISTSIPDAPMAGTADILFGDYDSLLAHANIGGSGDHWGFLLEGVRQETDGFKELDGGGNTGYALDDYVAKLRYATSDEARFYQEIELKLGRTEQDANETYMGLTDTDFARTPYRRYSASQKDNLVSEHEQYELRHFIELAPSLDIATALYRTDFARNWYKVQSVGGLDLGTILAEPATYSDQYAWITGIDSPDGAIVLRNNNREYYARGIQSVISWQPRHEGSLEHSVEIGLRWHEDEEDRLQDEDAYRMQSGNLILTADGAAGSQSNQVGSAEAFSMYLQDEMSLGRWRITPGIRYESIDMELRKYARSDPGRSEGPTSVQRSKVDQFIPGISGVYHITGDWLLLGGVNRGFNPPAPGSASNPEESVNFEFGTRYAAASFSGEAIAFYNDYSNLVGTCTASTGGNCEIGDQFDGGQVDMKGLELALGYEFQFASLGVPLQFSYTYTDARFLNSFSSGLEEWGEVESGDELPYIPGNMLLATAGLRDDRWGATVSAAWVDDMRSVAGQGAIAESELIEAHWVVDLAGGFDVTPNFSLNARIENLLDETYLAARRPAGARPGRPRSFFMGLTGRF
jgi:Fe(3+) dicitrate transport protein